MVYLHSEDLHSLGQRHSYSLPMFAHIEPKYRIGMRSDFCSAKSYCQTNMLDTCVYPISDMIIYEKYHCPYIHHNQLMVVGYIIHLLQFFCHYNLLYNVLFLLDRRESAIPLLEVPPTQPVSHYISGKDYFL